MKKGIVFLVLACLVAAIAFASLSNRATTQQKMDKEQDAKKEKKDCSRSCLFG